MDILNQRNKRGEPKNLKIWRDNFLIMMMKFKCWIQNKKEQEKELHHPFQAGPSTSGSAKEESKKATCGSAKTRATSGLSQNLFDPETCKKQIAKKSRVTWLTYLDLVKLKDATSLSPTTSLKLCWTGVTDQMFCKDYVHQASSKKSGKTKVSRYSCTLYVPKKVDQKCNYETTNAGQMGMHIHHCYLGLCIECKGCGVKSFRTCDMVTHLKDIHCNNAHVFYDSLLDLSSMKAKEVSAKMAQHMHDTDVELNGSGSD